MMRRRQLIQIAGSVLVGRHLGLKAPPGKPDIAGPAGSGAPLRALTLPTRLSTRFLANKVLQSTAPISIKSILAIQHLQSGKSLKRLVETLGAIYYFAPQLRLHPDDRYRPTSVSWFLPRVRMRRHRPHDTDVQILKVGEVNMASLISQSSGGQRSGRGSGRTNFFLEIRSQESATRRGDLDVAECYVRFRRAPGGSTDWDIQYWFFYAYNGDITTGADIEHEGDWEHVTARVTSDLRTLQRVFFASHAVESEWRDASDVSVADDHPVAYSAYHSHATAWSAGKQSRNWLPDDHTSNGGPYWSTWGNLRLIGERLDPMPGQEWVRYTGRWGQFGSPGPEWLTGPWGPAFQAWWDDDDEGNSG
jgi:hypothetical protein